MFNFNQFLKESYSISWIVDSLKENTSMKALDGTIYNVSNIKMNLYYYDVAMNKGY